MGHPLDSVHADNREISLRYDAIVIGSGISGGWAAMELCKRGLRTLLLERGRDVRHVQDYTTANLDPWDFPSRLELTQADRETNPVQSLVYSEGSKHFFVNDQEHPYIQEKPFNWIRGYQVGGRSLVWGRQTYRMSDLDFEANIRDGYGIDWPLRYKDLAPWYDYVERFVGISGKAEGITHLPDGIFLPPMEMNCVESHFKEGVERRFPGRKVIHGRVANLTRGWNGRGPCLFRNLCDRGCPFGGYFSSNSATLPVAMSTGNLTLRPHSIVYEIIYNAETRKAVGVRVIDERTMQQREYFARIIFLNASTIASTAILMNSKSREYPEGLGNTNGVLGRFLMDHHSGAGAQGEFDGFADKYYSGRRPTGIYIPRFRNVDKASEVKDFVRGYAYQADGERMEWKDTMHLNDDYGINFKETLLSPGPWSMYIGAWGECLPRSSNYIKLSDSVKDRWGLPLVAVNFEFSDNESRMRKDAQESAAEMLEVSGFDKVHVFDYNPVGGTTVHEMGTARMGNDPRDSILNEHNQVHDVKNLFITDGSCMTSGGCQNPSLTYMALTARACDFAVSEMGKSNL